MFLGFGIMLMFVFCFMVKNFVIEFIGIVGFSIICLVIGGFFIVSVVMLVYGLVID